MTREELNNLRKEKKLSLEYMSRAGNIALGTLKNFFYDKTKAPQIDTADAIAKMLGVSIDDIVYSDVEELKETIEEMDNPDAISVIALKKIYEFQLDTITALHVKEKEDLHRYYQERISEIKTFYEDRLKDKNDHISTILLDKKWFRLAAVFGVLAILALFFFIEFMTPGHGWFNFS